jgi:GNAT superfamily N-acetyltransferase
MEYKIFKSKAMLYKIEIIITTPYDKNVIPLLEDLSNNLGVRFGNDGKDSFQEWQNDNPKYLFAMACENSEIIGCGAFRPISENVAELKRMYSKYKRKGIGMRILTFLEAKAKEENYTEIWLETRKKNSEACHFYLNNGYKQIDNYGKYINNTEAICFGKKLNN